MGVDGRRFEVPVPEQDLDDEDVDMLLEQVRREAVAQCVHRHALAASAAEWIARLS